MSNAFYLKDDSEHENDEKQTHIRTAFNSIFVLDGLQCMVLIGKHPLANLSELLSSPVKIYL
jgi:hypothetical protein